MKKILLSALVLILWIGCGSNKVNNKSCKQGKIIDVRNYGAIVDDDIDDYEAILRAIKEINSLKGGTLLLHKGVYTINGHRRAASGQIPSNGIKNFIFENCHCLTIQGNGAIFNVDGNWVRENDYEHKGKSYSVHNAIGMEFVNCQDVVIKDLTLDGNCDKTSKIAEAEGTSHGLTVSGSINVSIENCYIHHYHSDGIRITSRQAGKNRYIQSKYVSIKDSNFTSNARLGCSIIEARHVSFENCIFSKTGNDLGAYGEGHSPMAGVDIEPNHHIQTGADDNTGNIRFSNCTFSNNEGFEYVASNPVSTPYPVRFDNCTFKNSSVDFNNTYKAVMPKSAETYFDNCSFDNVGLHPNISVPFDKDINNPVYISVFKSRFKSTIPAQKLLFSVGNSNVKLHVKQNTFDFNATEAAYGQYRIYLQQAQVIMENNTIFISKDEHRGNNYDTKFLFQHGTQSFANHWNTDLNKTNTFFIISYPKSNSTTDTHSPKKSFKQYN